MNKIAKITTATLVVVAAGATAFTASAGWGKHRDHCDHDRHGYGMEYEGKRGFFGKPDLDLSAEQVQTLVEAKMILRGNDRLKVGQVREKDDNTYLVDIVTVDDSLVKQIEIERDGDFSHRMFGWK